MNAARISQILETFPVGLALPTAQGPGIPHVNNHDGASRLLSQALMDPMFPWHYAMAFANVGKLIPGEAHELPIVHANDYIRGDIIRGETWILRRTYKGLFKALMFREPSWRFHRDFLEALLIIPSLTLPDIAKLTSADVPTVQYYENLFFNVRDRLDDKLFINQIVYPKTRQVETVADYLQNEDPGRLMIRAAYNSGLEAVLRIYGTKVDRDDSKPEFHARKLKTHVMAHALHMAETGGLNQGHSPVMKQAFKLMSAAVKDSGEPSDSEMGLTKLSMTPGQAVLYSLAGLDDNSQHQAKLKMQREQKAKEQADKKQEPGQSDKLLGT